MMIENVKTYATLKNLYVLYLYTKVFDDTVGNLYIMAVKGLLVMTAKIDSKNNAIFKAEKVHIIFQYRKRKQYCSMYLTDILCRYPSEILLHVVFA